MALSLAEQVAILPPAERDAVLADLDPEKLEWDSKFWLRPEQIEPVDDYRVWLILAGRGFGKTRAGSEWVREKARETSQGRLRMGIVAKTAADVRDTVVEGLSGILAVHPPSERPIYEPSKRLLTWPNGNECLLFSSETPDQLSGPSLHYVWGDEFAAWSTIPDSSGLTAFDNSMFATR